MVLLALGCASPAPPPARQAPVRTPVPTAVPTPTPVAGVAYPAAPIEYHTDDVAGRDIVDHYRWLENGSDPRTVEWLKAEEALTRSLLDRPERAILQERLTRLYDFPKLSTPILAGNRYFFSRGDGRVNQPVWYVQEGPHGTRRELLDPNTMSPDGTVAVDTLVPSRDGRLAAYIVTTSGSDRQEILVRDVATGKDLPDRLKWVKFSGVSWTRDGKGFYYTRYPEPGTVPAGEEHYFPKITFHRLGTPQQKDRTVFERPREKDLFFGAGLSYDGRWLILTSWRSDQRTEVSVLDTRNAAARPRAVLQGFDARWLPIDVFDGKLYLLTDKDAPRQRVVRVDLARLPAKGSAAVAEVVPEGSDALDFAALAGGKLVLHRLRKAQSALSVAARDGSGEQEVALPGMGVVSEIQAWPDRSEIQFSFVSFTQPSTPYRMDVTARTPEAFETPASAPEAAELETEQTSYRSADGTEISMFLVHKKGLPRDGNRPVYLYGYGGFNTSMTPWYSVGALLLTSAGGVLAVPNLRGGGEYGEEWHQAGMREKRQNVYDDFLAAADWLVKAQWSNPKRIAISGGSNGGLLTAWCLLRHPEKFGAVISQVPVTDLLRFHKFTVGRYWIGEYGNPDDPNDFPFLFRFSPYHQVRDGRSYPPTLITTADTDDRVDPSHARKFAARLQYAQRGPGPILLRVETRAGHGHGKSREKTIAEWADIWTFVFWQLGIEPGP
jgi:prolyl oligopeptidase